MPRLLGVEIPGDKRIEASLPYIYGIGPSLAKKVLEHANIDPNTRAKNLSPEQEVAADREYFGTEHSLPFPVAINEQIKPDPKLGYRQPKPDTDYRVGGIPQIMIVDKRGIIRQIVTGWDQGNTARFSKYIEMLLAERVTPP